MADPPAPPSADGPAVRRSSPRSGPASRQAPPTQPSLEPSSTRLLLFILLAFSFALRALAFLRPIPSLDGVTIPDDTYYTLHLARSMARGLGPFYGLGHTNGFQPLIGFLLVPTFWLFGDADLLGPVRAAMVISALADTAALWMLARILLRQIRDARVVAVVMIIWAVSPYTIANGINGLETSLAVFLLLAAVSYFPRTEAPDAGPRTFFLFGVLGGLALFARIDTGLMLAVAALLSARRLVSRGLGVAVRAAAATAAGVVLVNLPWWLYSYRYTGRIYPVSGRAVRHISQAAVHHHPTLKNFYIPEIREGVRVLLVSHWPTLILLGVLVVLIAWRSGRQGLRQLARDMWQQRLLLVLSAALFCAYTMYIFTEWFFTRYFYPINAALLLCTGLALHRWLEATAPDDQRRRRRLLPVAALYMLASIARKDFRDIYLSNDSVQLASMNIGLWARQHYPAGTIVGCPQSGGLGYFADNLTVVNLDGVVNQDAYLAMKEHRLFDYIRESKIKHLLTWSNTIDLIREESAEIPPGELTVEMVLTGVRTYRKPWHVYRVTSR
jgi:4-amino-4-deoxy-L-arabinose transferase-like glycosyltransferase